MAKYLDENGLASVWSKFKSLLNSHINNRNNPHQLTKNQIGLNNVDNTSDLNKPISTATQNALGGKYNYFTHPKGTYDADNITQVGRHYFAEESTLTHFPNPSYLVGKFDMVVENGAEGMLIQRTAYDGDEEYLRTKMGSGSWSSWKHIQSVDDTMISNWNAKASTSVATTTANGLMAKEDKTKINGIAAGAEVNQNAFSHVQVGGTTLSADQKVDVLTLAAGANVTLTPDAATDKVTISSTNTTYGLATPTADGLMAKGDKSKLDGIAVGADKNQNAYSSVDWNGTTVSAGSINDTISFNLKGDVFESYTESVGSGKKLCLGLREVNSSRSGLMGIADKMKLDTFGAASTYALKSDIVGMYKYKGSVADATKLPTTGQVTGDVYNIVAASVYGGPGANVAWDGTRWDSLGEIFQVTSMTASEIDAICV